MAAAEYHRQPNTINDRASWFGTVTKETAFYGAVTAAVLFVVILNILILADLRSWLYTTKNQLERADELLISVNQQSPQARIQNYLSKKTTSNENHNHNHHYPVQTPNTPKLKPLINNNNTHTSPSVLLTTHLTAISPAVSHKNNRIHPADDIFMLRTEEMYEPHDVTQQDESYVEYNTRTNNNTNTTKYSPSEYECV